MNPLPRTSSTSGMSVRRIVALVLGVLIVIVLLSAVGSIFELNPANDILVVQSPFSGHLTVYATPGVKWQGFGTATHYQKRAQFSFSNKKDQGSKVDESLKVRYNDGGHANISGVISWEMPTDTNNMIRLHTLFGSQTSIEQQLVRPAIERSLYLTGPLMSSAESYAARRNEFLRFFEEQASQGIYKTDTISMKQPDPITGQEKTVNVVKIVMDGPNPAIQSPSPIKEFGIILLPPSINEIKYDETVEKQIAQQQAAIMQVQTAQARAREAEQEAITAAKRGEAEAAKAKWEQEVIKAKEVTAAEQRKRVAELDAETAAQYKRKQVLEGEGESEKRRLIMSADGALARKLETYEKVQAMWAQAFEKFQGQLVPSVVAGSAGGAQGNAALSFMELMGIKAARDLALDTQVGPAPAKK